MTSIGAASTNDVSSTAHSTAATESGDDSGLNVYSQQQQQQQQQHAGQSILRRGPASTLTSDGIIKECIRQGFYRNPICNEKLYLHNKGYDSIHPAAFELYTDVKVLWLEGNALAVLPCGGELVRVQPPKNKRVLYPSSSSEEEEAEEEDDGDDALAGAAAAARPIYADPTIGLNSAAAAEGAPATPEQGTAAEMKTKTQRKKTAPGAAGRAVREPLPESAAVALEDRDGFSSLYPTVRQLYLHNNIFRTMPDLSRFERLDAVNLANNFFSCVEPHCLQWDRGLRDYREALEEEELAALGLPAPAPAGEATRTLEKAADGEDSIVIVAAEKRRAVADASDDDDDNDNDNANKSSNSLVARTGVEGEEGEPRTVSSEEARKRRAARLAAYRAVADSHMGFCTHEPLPDHSSSKSDAPDRHRHYHPHREPRVPPAMRNPCSSLRTLNLSGNHLHSFADVVGLLCYKGLSVLDLSQNRISDGEALLIVLERLPNLKSLKLSGNPLVRSLPKYRKTVLSRCTHLLHLDDRPVFDEERRLVTAWARGGDAAEAEERRAIKKENDAAVQKRIDDFRKLLGQHRSNHGSKSGGDGGAGEEKPAKVLDPSHVAYLNAVSGTAEATATKRSARERKARALIRDQRNSDPDDSPTSSEEEEEGEDDIDVGSSNNGEGKDVETDAAAAAAAEAKGEATGEDEGLVTDATAKAAAAEAALRDNRVLSSNGSGGSPRKRFVVEIVEGDEEDDDANVFIPS